jgi:hypothetical protein
LARRATQERGYRGDSLEEFATTLGDWMRGRPSTGHLAAESACEMAGTA